MKKLLWLCVLCCSVPSVSSAQSEIEVTHVSGTVEVLLRDADEYAAAEEGMKLEKGDSVSTGSDGVVELGFNADNSDSARVSESGTVEIVLDAEEKLSLIEGEIFASVNSLDPESSFEIRTPTAVSGARGTEWVTIVSGESTEIEAISDIPYIRHFENGGSLSKEVTLVQPGQMTTVRKFQKPLPPRQITESRRHQWQEVRSLVKKHAQEAVVNRSRRPQFKRSEFLDRLKEGGGTRPGPGKPFRDTQPDMKPLQSRERIGAARSEHDRGRDGAEKPRDPGAPLISRESGRKPEHGGKDQPLVSGEDSPGQKLAQPEPPGKEIHEKRARAEDGKRKQIPDAVHPSGKKEAPEHRARPAGSGIRR